METFKIDNTKTITLFYVIISRETLCTLWLAPVLLLEYNLTILLYINSCIMCSAGGFYFSKLI